MTNSERKKELGSPVPSFHAELGTRLREVEKLFENRAAAAAVAGVSKTSFQSWVSGKADPSFAGLARLSAVTGISLDWLATGRGESRCAAGAAPVDQGLLEMIVEELERFRDERRLAWDAKTRARLITLGYAMMIEAREKGGKPSAGDLQYLLKAAS